jgi:hypothetical protein
MTCYNRFVRWRNHTAATTTQLLLAGKAPSGYILPAP